MLKDTTEKAVHKLMEDTVILITKDKLQLEHRIPHSNRKSQFKKEKKKKKRDKKPLQWVTENVQTVNKHVRWYITLLVIREIQNSTNVIKYSSPKWLQLK